MAIYIDGSNFYYKLRELKISNIIYFGYQGLAEKLAGKRKITIKRYYVGAVRSKEKDKRGQKLRRGQIKLFNHLSSSKQGFSIQRGYLMKNDGVYHEKGVDVKIAVDLLVGAYENLYDTAILVSSDTDLIPAIQKVRQLKKDVEYIGFSYKPSYGLIKNATETRLLTKNDVKEFEFASKKKK